jgi:hypothetical protein
MEIVLKIFAGLTGLMGIFVFLTALVKSFSHKGMVLAGLSYLIGGFVSLYLVSWVPALTGIVVAIIIKKYLSEPDYSENTTIKTSINLKNQAYQLWVETYKPLMGVGEPMNYMNVIDKFTDMTQEEKDAYAQEKIDGYMFWTVIDKGNNKWLVRPGQHEGNVRAWWFCDVPYSETAKEIEIQF